MHRAGVFVPGCGARGRFGIEGHSTLGTGPRAQLPYFGAHRTDIMLLRLGRRLATRGRGWQLIVRRGCSCGDRRTERYYSRRRSHSHRIGRRRQNLFWVRLELRQATGGAEEVLFALVQCLVASGFGIYIHPADWVFGHSPNVRSLYLNHTARWQSAAAELCSAWTGEGARRHTKPSLHEQIAWRNPLLIRYSKQSFDAAELGSSENPNDLP